MGKSRTPYPQEFRDQIVAMVRGGRTAEELSREFEPSSQCIRNWVRQAKGEEVVSAGGLSGQERMELRRLREEVRRLRVEREILKKAAAWFAQESGSIPKPGSNS